MYLQKKGRANKKSKGVNKTLYLVLVVTNILVCLVAVLLYQNKQNLNPKVFLTAALLNAGALLGLLALQQRRKK